MQNENHSIIYFISYMIISDDCETEVYSISAQDLNCAPCCQNKMSRDFDVVYRNFTHWNL